MDQVISNFADMRVNAKELDILKNLEKRDENELLEASNHH
jgi:hypothetical protein